MLTHEAKSNPLRAFQSWLASDDSFHAKLTAASVAGATAIVLLAVVFFDSYARERDSGHQRDATFEILGATDRAEADVDALEGALRDFLLNGSPDFLAQFHERQASLQSRLAQLTVLMDGDDHQQERIESVTQRLAQWESRFAEPQIATRNETRASSNAPDRTRGAVLLAEVRSTLAALGRYQLDESGKAARQADDQRQWQTYADAGVRRSP